MALYDITALEDKDKIALVDARWNSSEEVWKKVIDTYKANTAIYENRAYWLDLLPERRRQYAVQANRIFVNMEAVINTLIANPPGINLLPSREGEAAQAFARKLESFLRKKFIDRNTKEILRMGLRNLYFARMIAIKPFWNPVINDFDFRALDPRKIRVAKHARKEQDSEFYVEEIDDNLCAVVQRFPGKKTELMRKYGFPDTKEGHAQMYIKNPDVQYREAWINDYVVFKLEGIVLDTIKNPYWDWDGILVTDEEEEQLAAPGMEGEQRRNFIQNIKLDQENRQASYAAQNAPVEPEAAPSVLDRLGNAVSSMIMPDEGEPEEQVPLGEVQPTQGATSGVDIETPVEYHPYFFNFFDQPRKPIIFATIFNNENSPIGRTDMITLSSSLQKGIDKRKCDIDENAELVNGMLKVDATVMSKAEAQRIRFETKGIIWGKNVQNGVSREMGTPLPEFVFNDMIDSRQEIDNIMAATSAFRGEREGQETKAGRLALINQSYLRLNELVQVVDYVSQEMFAWALQLAKTRYTEYHYAKWMGKDGAREMIDLIQDDIENGTEVTVISGKSLPVDNEFKFEQAQNDVEKGYISPQDYLDIAQYDNAKELSQNAVKYQINPAKAVGIPDEEMAQLAPQKKEEKPPTVSISYKDLPPDAQIQLLAQIGIQANPDIVFGEKMAQQRQQKEKDNLEGERTKADIEAMRTPPEAATTE